MNSQCKIFLFDVFFWANCKLIASNFSAMEFMSFTSVSAIFSPSKVFTGVQSVLDISNNISESGTDNPCSHYETDCRTTFSFTASSCCERPFAFRIALMFSLSIMIASFYSVVVFIISKSICCNKQCILTLVHYKTCQSNL